MLRIKRISTVDKLKSSNRFWDRTAWSICVSVCDLRRSFNSITAVKMIQ